jgi:hypothetical protein
MTRFEKLLFAITFFLIIQTAAALSLSIPKPLIDLGVAKKFPKEKLTITLDQPVLG